MATGAAAPSPLNPSSYPSQRTWPFGTEQPGPCFSVADATRRTNLAKLEREAFEQMACEIAYVSYIGRNTVPRPDATALNGLTSRCVPPEAALNKFNATLLNRSDGIERTAATDAVPVTDAGQEARQYALTSYVGTWVKHTDDALTNPARAYWQPGVDHPDDDLEIGLTGDPGTRLPDWWIVPSTSEDGRFACMYKYTKQAVVRREDDSPVLSADGTVTMVTVADHCPYGTPLELEGKFELMAQHYDNARKAMSLAYADLADGRHFDPPHGTSLGIAKPASMAHVQATLGAALNATTARAQHLRELVIERLRELTRGNVLLRGLRQLNQELLTRRRADCGGESRFVAQIASDELLGVLSTDMAPGTAAALMQVLRGARVDRVQGAEHLLDPLAKRFPHLHIHIVPGQFPHEGPRRDAERTGEIRKDQQLSISISMVTERARCLVRAERRAAKLEDLRVDDAHAELPELKEDDFGPDNPEDLGYRKDEAALNQLDASLSDGDVTFRRVKNNGWSRVTQWLDPETCYKQCNPLSYFVAPPLVQICLVRNDAERTPVRDDRWGGMVPERGLRLATGRMRLCEERPLARGEISRRVFTWRKPSWVMSNQTLQQDGEPSPACRVRAEMSRSYPPAKHGALPCGPHINRAIIARFDPACLSSETDDSKLRIVVTATGRSRVTNLPLKLKAESGPLVFVADRRVGRLDKRSNYKPKSPGSSRASSPAVHKRPRAA